MQVFKISFVLALFFVLCSFGTDASYKATQYQQFLSKFSVANSSDAMILDVRINMPLPVSYEELEAANLSSDCLREVVEERMLMREFDIFISEISKKQKGGMRPKTYEAEFLVKQSKNLDIVVYSEYQDSRQYTKTYYMAVFTKMGVVLAKERIGMSNKNVYTEVNINNRFILDAISIIDGQELPLSAKKIKIQRKGNVDVLEEEHPYLDKTIEELRVEGVGNYRLR